MISSPSTIRLALIAGLALRLFTGAPFVHGQAAAPIPSHEEQGAYGYVHNVRSVDEFIQYVGKEDERIQKETEQGKTQIVGRSDYAKALRFNPDEEQLLLSTLLEAYRKDKEVDKRLGCDALVRRDEFNRLYGVEQTTQMVKDQEIECPKEKLPIAQEAAVKLRDQLEPDSLRRFDRWVSNGLWMEFDKAPIDPNPCPLNGNPPAGQTSHLACVGTYADFFEDIGKNDDWNRQMVSEDRASEIRGYYMPIQLSEEQKQKVIAVGIKNYHELEENDKRLEEAEERYRQQQGVGFDITKIGPEAQAINLHGPVIIEENIFKLEQEIGKTSFRQFDFFLSKSNPRITKGTREPSAATAPAPGSTQGVQP
jgi:hypothetical protein